MMERAIWSPGRLHRHIVPPILFAFCLVLGFLVKVILICIVCYCLFLEKGRNDLEMDEFLGKGCEKVMKVDLEFVVSKIILFIGYIYVHLSFVFNLNY